jgi:hypothetical protein
MERLASIWAFAVVLAVAAQASAVEKVQTHYIDPGVEYQLPSGETVRYYTFSAYKMLLKVDFDLWATSQQTSEYQKMLGGFSDMLKLKDQLIESKQAEVNVYMTRSERLQDAWGKCQEALAKEKDGFSWTSFGLGLGIGAGVTAVVVTGMVIFFAVNK